MAKIYGLFGAMTGKVADVVMSVRGGEQTVRKYQPVVYNPNTQAQIAARARLKLMSQLSAIFASILPLRKSGNVSGRNKFVALNYEASGYANDAATIDMSAVKLTDSVLSLPSITATRSGGGVNVALSSGDGDISRVVYVAFRRDGEELRYDSSVVVTAAGENNTFNGVIPVASASTEMFVYAYGVRDNTEAARVAFGNLTLQTAAAVANLIVTSVLLQTDVTLTETRYGHLDAPQG